MAEGVRVGVARLDFVSRVSQFLNAGSKAVSQIDAQKRAIRQLRSETRRLNRQVSNTIRGFLSIRSAAAVLAGSGGLGLIVKRAASAGASLVEVAAATGSTVEELQGLRRAFEGDGIGIEKTDLSLQRLNRSLGEARDGVRTYVDAFNDIGVDVNVDRSLTDTLALISRRFAQIGDPALKTRVAMDLFGRSGARLITTLQRGEGSFRSTVAEMQALGVATQAEAERLKSLDQSFTSLGNVIQTAFLRGVAQSADEMRALVGVLTDRLPRAFSALIQGAAFVAENFELMLRIARDLFLGVLTYKLLARVALGLTAAGSAGQFFANSLIAARAAAAALGRLFLVGVIATGIGSLIDYFTGLDSSVQGVSESIRQQIVDLRKLNEELAAGAVFNREQAAGELAAARQRAADAKTALANLRAQHEGLQQLRNAQNRLEIERRRLGGRVPEFLAEEVREARLVVEADPELRGAEALVRNTQATVKRLEEAFARAGASGNVSVFARGISDALNLQLAAARELNLLITARTAVSRAEAQTLLAAARSRQASAQRALDEFNAAVKTTQAYKDQAAVLAALEASGTATAGEITDARLALDALAAPPPGLIQFLATATENAQGLEASIKAASGETVILGHAFNSVASASTAIEKLTEAQKRLRAAAETVRSSFETFFLEAASGAQTVREAMDDLLRSVARLVIQYSIAQPLAASLTGAIFPAGTLPGGTPSVPAAAEGGLVSGMTLVGERGPELVDFRQPAQVYSNADLRAALGRGGGGAVNLTFAPVINNSDAVSVRAALEAYTPEFERLAKGAVSQELARPSLLRDLARRG